MNRFQSTCHRRKNNFTPVNELSGLVISRQRGRPLDQTLNRSRRGERWCKPREEKEVHSRVLGGPSFLVERLSAIAVLRRPHDGRECFYGAATYRGLNAGHCVGREEDAQKSQEGR